MTRSTPRNALFAVVTLALSACAAGPRYVAPETAPGAWLAGSADAGAVDLEWWTRFDDPQLTALVNAALAGNFDLLAAGVGNSLFAAAECFPPDTILPQNHDML